LVGDGSTQFEDRAETEAMLDIEQITSMGGNIETEFWGFAGKWEHGDTFFKWLGQLSNTSDADVPKVFSTSYGYDENTWSPASARRLNIEFMKAGVRGISLLVASGDNGAYGSMISSKFEVRLPAASPYVTTVGGTKPGLLHPEPGSEVAWGSSGGGFSNYMPMPDYQKDAVKGYLQKKGLPSPKKGYNTSGRAIPDIAAQAVDFPLLKKHGSDPSNNHGTSAASPTVAGVISLINDLRLQHGMSTLGFLNPMLYDNGLGLGKVFNDIVSGSSGGGFLKGWPAKEGWDAVTGLGTINYKKLAEVALSLPPGRSRQSTQPLDTVSDRHLWSPSLVTFTSNHLRLPSSVGVDDHDQATIFRLPKSDAKRSSDAFAGGATWSYPHFPVPLPKRVLMSIAPGTVMVISCIFFWQFAFCRNFKAPFSKWNPHWSSEAECCDPLLPGGIS